MEKELLKLNIEKNKDAVLDIILNFPGSRKNLEKDLKTALEDSFDVNNPNYKIANKEASQIALKILRTFENDSHCALAESFNDTNRMPALEMANDLIKELNCINEIEKSLASSIAMSYMRFLDNSRRLNNELECREITPNKNIYIANLSKQIDRAYRQYITSLVTLQQLKTPKLELTVKTQNAFIGQNNIQPNI